MKQQFKKMNQMQVIKKGKLTTQEELKQSNQNQQRSTQIKNNIPKAQNPLLEKALLLNSIKQATNIIATEKAPSQEQVIGDQILISEVVDYQQVVMMRNDQSSILDEDVSIAQEFSRIDEDSDIDEKPKT